MVQANWQRLFNTNEDHIYKYADVELELKDWSGDGFCNFLISTAKAATSGHINIKHSYNPAHLTLLSWDGARKTNYFFELDQNRKVIDSKPQKSSVEGTSEKFSALPGEIKQALKIFVERVYEGS